MTKRLWNVVGDLQIKDDDFQTMFRVKAFGHAAPQSLRYSRLAALYESWPWDA